MITNNHCCTRAAPPNTHPSGTGREKRKKKRRENKTLKNKKISFCLHMRVLHLSTLLGRNPGVFFRQQLHSLLFKVVFEENQGFSSLKPSSSGCFFLKFPLYRRLLIKS
uniref:Uncharacterized protein n=1 Tax=Nelumbo nucifera TaxID=4432 RepID=A0A822YSU4_NELNU|nr:TPA_asm: hypothetical protein HUJ06_005281 [Nelumbo nucifera]